MVVMFKILFIAVSSVLEFLIAQLVLINPAVFCPFLSKMKLGHVLVKFLLNPLDYMSFSSPYDHHTQLNIFHVWSVNSFQPIICDCTFPASTNRQTRLSRYFKYYLKFVTFTGWRIAYLRPSGINFVIQTDLKINTTDKHGICVTWIVPWPSLTVLH